ncbi:MAG: glycosyltransferase family 39 protein [Thaumarchaeota archaeon]|nr:glycosyltransferase family 39 protein [Nitrososphaerota archaeon]
MSIAQEPSFSQFVTSYLSSERQPPLHHFFLYVTGKVTGETTDLVMRFPSALAGLATVMVLFFLGRTLGGARLGLVAAFLLALSPTFVLYSRMARYYSFSLLFSTASCLLFLKLLEAEERNGSSRRRVLYGAGYGLSTLLMLFSSYPTAFIFFMENVYAFHHVFQRRLALKDWILAQVPVIISFGAWLIWILPVMAGYRGSVSPFSIQGLPKIILTLIYPFYSFSVGETIFPWHPLALVGLLATIVLFLVILKNARIPAIRFSLHMFVGSVAGTLFVFLFVLADIPFITAASRSIFSLPFFSLLLAAGFLSLRKNWLKLVLGAGLVAAYSFALSNYFSNQQFHNPVYVVPTKEMLSSVLSQAVPGDLIISDRDTGIEFYWPNGKEQPAHYLSNDTDQLIGLLSQPGNPRVWLVTLGRDRTRGDTPESLENWLTASYSQKQEWGYARQDPMYREVKRRILGYEDYEYKALVRLYTNG